MYLFPTKKELNALWRQINPRDRYLAAVRAAVDEACRFGEESMASFFIQSEDTELLEEEGAMVYHIDPPAYLDSPRDVCPVRFKGWDIELPKSQDEYKGIDLGETVSWEDI